MLNPLVSVFPDGKYPEIKDGSIMMWPGDNRSWMYIAEEGKYKPGPAAVFDGGDSWEDEE